MNPYALAHYRKLRTAGWRASNAYRAALIRDAFEDMENAGLVKLELEPDHGAYEEGDMFDPHVNANISPSRLEKERKALYERLAREGHWILVGYWRASEDAAWKQVDSIGGFIGEDWQDSGDDDDIRKSCLDSLVAYREREACRQATEFSARATYAG